MLVTTLSSATPLPYDESADAGVALHQALSSAKASRRPVLVIFGAGKIPQVGKGLGEGIRNFKDAIKDGAGEKPGPKDKDSGQPS